ncbi:ABC transporter substrate-binding protein [Blastococcus brunescens]|uniref:ABC transporter substrate-binding protein n=1 Tax=Blastococcus brunescens TaxID=1564165 RepID=UPI003BEF2C7A
MRAGAGGGQRAVRLRVLQQPVPDGGTRPGPALRIVAAASRETRPPDRFVEALVVGPDSDVQSPADLANSTIAVNTLNSLQQAAVQATLEEAGVDLSTVEFVEIGLPDVPLALREGRVDAGHTGEPFVTLAEQDGSRVIADSYEAIEEGLDISSWFTTDTFLEQSPDVTESFLACMDTARAYAEENPDEVRSFLPGFMNVDPELAQEVQLGSGPRACPRSPRSRASTRLRSSTGCSSRTPSPIPRNSSTSRRTEGRAGWLGVCLGT